jgi:hypothetical protein
MLYRAMFFFFNFLKLPHWRFSTRRFSHVWLYTILALCSHENKTWGNRDVIHRFCQIPCYPARTKSSQLCSTLAVEAIATPTASHPPTHTHATFSVLLWPSKIPVQVPLALRIEQLGQLKLPKGSERERESASRARKTAQPEPDPTHSYQTRTRTQT